MLKQKIVMGLLALGTLGGFAAGFASLSCHAKQRRERWKDEVAQTCVKAARTVDAEEQEGSSEEPRRERRRHRHHDEE